MSPEVILETSHGRRSIDILKILAPEKANWDCKLSFSLDPLPLELPSGLPGGHRDYLAVTTPRRDEGSSPLHSLGGS